MYAKNLQELLERLHQGCDVSSVAEDEFAQRFSSMRRCNVLPRGRENRDKHLTMHQVAGAILGLTSQRPDWAGHSSAVLSSLQTVGGIDASFHKCLTLKDTLEHLLTDANARQAMIAITLTCPGLSYQSLC